jgi:small subunit ribosomal protein S6
MMIVLAPDVPEDELDPSIDTIESYVTRFGGDVIAINRDSPWGRRRLAYPIRHQSRDVRDGFYALYYFDAEPETLIEIEREIRLNERIIRHMVIALDEQVTLLPPPAPEAPAEGDASDETAAESDVTTEATADDEATEAASDDVAAEADAEASAAEDVAAEDETTKE